MKVINPALLCCSSLSIILAASVAVDTLNVTQSIGDGDTLVSNDGTYALGFFSPGSSGNKYLAIWHNRVPDTDRVPVWIANREKPLFNSSGTLKITNQGVLHLLHQDGSIIWFSNVSRPATNWVALQLLDSGNLVVKNEGSEDYLWQSFDYPTDSVIPGMKNGWSRTWGMRYIQSWKAADDPSPGDFVLKVQLGGFPEYFMSRDSTKVFRYGPWNGLRFSGTPQLNQTPISRYEFVLNDQEVYFRYYLQNSSSPFRRVLAYDGVFLSYAWIERTQQWVPFNSVNVDDCDTYARCGTYGICDSSKAQVCGCLDGFVSNTSSQGWEGIGLSNGCVRKTQLNCTGDGFLKYSGMKLPDTENSWFNQTMKLMECNSTCLNNCSCTAYAILDITEGRGCLIWFNDLIDVRQAYENGQDIYIRMAASELPGHGDSNSKSNQSKKTSIIIVPLLLVTMLLLGLVLVLYFRRKKQRGTLTNGNEGIPNIPDDLELPLFDLETVTLATNNFSNMNKLGEGGYGPVYKGMLKDGQAIAVKRLSTSSEQGIQEFKNEVMYIAKLQHRNLVKLLGCCIEANEKMLIYECMPNKSLDSFIFDQNIRTMIDWPTRYRIINGIARGLLYLHQDSRLQIIHRDLKASNVLLDYEMNPKISDFGLARCFGGNQTKANTKRVVGTYGYMSPEYAIDGQYSVKSDVFSFGVMILEIVSGKRNRGFWHPEHHLNLLGHAWKLYNEKRCTELITASIRDEYNISEVLRSIHIGLLCVQRSPKDRPSMSEVVFWLGSGGILDHPNQPGFFTERDFTTESSSSGSANKLTISLLQAR